jgi:sodium/hydrogen antiporter
VGLIVGFAGAALLVIASRHQWIAPGGRRLATLAVAIASLAAALAIDANGFIAAFVAGITFGAWLNHSEQAAEEVGELPELGGELLALVVWFLFGATLAHVAFDVLDGALVVYALASLTIIRVLPVALCSVRAGLDRPSVTFIARFGPRGLASVVFALLAVEELGQASPAVQQAVAAVSLTVLLSVVLHGVSAGPAGRRYVRSSWTCCWISSIRAWIAARCASGAPARASAWAWIVAQVVKGSGSRRTRAVAPNTRYPPRTWPNYSHLAHAHKTTPLRDLSAHT